MFHICASVYWEKLVHLIMCRGTVIGMKRPFLEKPKYIQFADQFDIAQFIMLM